MNTQYVVVLSVAFALGVGMLAGVGFFQATGGGGSGDVVVDRSEEIADNNSLNVNGSAGGENNEGIVGFIIDGVGKAVGVIKLALVLPTALQDLGFPNWFAGPIGIAIELILVIGVAQFAANRVYR